MYVIKKGCLEIYILISSENNNFIRGDVHIIVIKQIDILVKWYTGIMTKIVIFKTIKSSSPYAWRQERDTL